MNEQIYSAQVIDFVRLAANFCVKLENCQNAMPREFVKSLVDTIPYLYVSAAKLVNTVGDNGLVPESQVTEDDYNFIRHSVYNVLGQYDEYLEVFIDDMKYSDQPIICSISESLADIYQDLRNFLAVYKGGVEEITISALYLTLEDFCNEWGQKCVNVMRALHDVCYRQMDEEA